MQPRSRPFFSRQRERINRFKARLVREAIGKNNSHSRQSRYKNSDDTSQGSPYDTGNLPEPQQNFAKTSEFKPRKSLFRGSEPDTLEALDIR